MKDNRLWLKLGYAGLLPFIGLTWLSVKSDIVIGISTNFAFACYSAAILSFLAGTLWLEREGQQTFGPTLCSNLLTLLAFISLLLSYPIGLVLLLIGHLLMFWCELTYGLFSDKPQGYKVMRIWLTTIVVVCHFVLLSTLLF